MHQIQITYIRHLVSCTCRVGTTVKNESLQSINPYIIANYNLTTVADQSEPNKFLSFEC